LDFEDSARIQFERDISELKPKVGYRKALVGREEFESVLPVKVCPLNNAISYPGLKSSSSAFTKGTVRNFV